MTLYGGCPKFLDTVVVAKEILFGQHSSQTKEKSQGVGTSCGCHLGRVGYTVLGKGRVGPGLGLCEDGGSPFQGLGVDKKKKWTEKKTVRPIQGIHALYIHYCIHCIYVNCY